MRRIRSPGSPPRAGTRGGWRGCGGLLRNQLPQSLRRSWHQCQWFLSLCLWSSSARALYRTGIQRKTIQWKNTGTCTNSTSVVCGINAKLAAFLVGHLSFMSMPKPSIAPYRRNHALLHLKDLRMKKPVLMVQVCPPELVCQYNYFHVLYRLLCELIQTIFSQRKLTAKLKLKFNRGLNKCITLH